MIVHMSEYSLMGKYSLGGCCILILYSIIDKKYVEMGNVSYISFFLTIIHINTTAKEVYKDLPFC